MELYHETVQDGSGNIINGATITVTDHATGSPSTIYDKDGVSISNPFLSGYDRSKGEIDFKAANGLYDIQIVSSDTTTIKSIALVDADNLAEYVNNVTALRALTPVNQSRIYLKAHTSEGDKGNGYYRGVTGAAPGTYTDNGGTIITPSGGDGSTAWLFDEPNPTVLNFGAHPNNGDSTTAISSALTTLGVIDLADGSLTYTITSISSSANDIVIKPRGATLQLAASGSVTSILDLSGDNIKIEDTLIIDGNRANSTTVSSHGVYIHDSSGHAIDKIKAINVPNIGIYINLITDSEIKELFTDNCAAGQGLQNMDRVNILAATDQNLAATVSGVYQHCIDFFYNTDCRLSNVLIYNADGNTTAPSAWLSGLTTIKNTRCHIDNVRIIDMVSSTLIPLAMSILTADNCKYTNFTIKGWQGNRHIEVKGCSNNLFSDFSIIEDYTTQYVGAGTEGGNYGFIMDNAGEIIAGSGKRHQAQNSKNAFKNFHIQGVNRGAVLGGAYNTFDNFTVVGNKDTGLEIKWQDGNTANFASAPQKNLTGNKLVNSLIACNGRYGVYSAGSATGIIEGTMLNGNTIINNGQEQAAISARYGVFLNGNIDYPFVVNNDLRDTQTFTYNNLATFTPAALASNTAFDITLKSNAEVLLPGQRIVLVGASPSATDLTVKVIDVKALDEVSVIPISVTTGTMTAPTTTGTGTISTSGTAVTGVGTSFDTEILGRVWIKYGSEYRQVVKVISATAMTLDTGFSSDAPGGTALTIVETDIDGVPSQTRGLEASVSTTTNVTAFGNRYDGVTDAVPFRLYQNMEIPTPYTSLDFDGLHNQGYIKLRNNYLWVDATGDLRIKATAPTSDTDGTVVGTQT